MSETRLVNTLRPLALLLCLCAAAYAQGPDGQSPERGFHPNGSYAVSDQLPHPPVRFRRRVR